MVLKNSAMGRSKSVLLKALKVDLKKWILWKENFLYLKKLQARLLDYFRELTDPFYDINHSFKESFLSYLISYIHA